MKKHKHKWYETSLIKDKSTQTSYACKCGCWKIENVGEDIKMKIIKWKIEDYKKLIAREENKKISTYYA